jgi:hypothetical protein
MEWIVWQERGGLLVGLGAPIASKDEGKARTKRKIHCRSLDLARGVI